MIVDKDNRLSGSVALDGSLEIEGVLSGEAKIGGDFVVAESGQAEGSVRCERAVIAGSFSGLLVCRSSAKVMGSATIRGKISAPEVEFDSGGGTEAPVHPKDAGDRAARSGAAAVREPGREEGKKIPLVTGREGKLLVRPTSVLKETT